MPLKIVKVVIYGISGELNLSTQPPNYQPEYSDIETLTFVDDAKFVETYVNWEPDIVVVIGNVTHFPNICEQQSSLKSKLYILSKEELDYRGLRYFVEEFFKRYVANSIQNYNFINKISVYTASCNTKERLYVAYESLKKQTHQNWEWSIYDDSTDDVTWNVVKDIAKSDTRVIINKNHNQSSYSRIGYNKFTAATHCSSNYIVELDHDDALTFDALDKILLTHKRFPDCGFVFGDWAEMNFETKQEIDYGDGYAWGYGSYYTVKHPHHDRELKVACAPSLNPLTIRRLWSLFNHPKSWKKDVYMKIGGHNRYLNSADDYELMLRTFLNTKMVHLHHYCYEQYMYNDNTKVSNGGLGWKYHGDIMRHVRYIQTFYSKKIKQRIEELGKVDWAYDDSNPDCVRNFYHGLKQTYYGENEQRLNLDFKP
jgi:glycosyltransferase involved in cell wall biosynthesis